MILMRIQHLVEKLQWF